MKINQYSISNVLSILMILCLILSQINFVASNILRLLMYVLFVVNFINLFIFRKKIKLNKFHRLFLLLSLLSVIYNAILIIIFNYPFIETIKNLLLSLGFYTLGSSIYFIDKDNKIFRNICITYSISCLILAIAIRYIDFSNITSWYNSEIYLFQGGKNRIGVILAFSILINFIYIIPETRKKIVKIFFIVCSLIIFYVLCLIQCRTAIIVSVFLLCAYYMIKNKLNIKLVIIFSILILLFLTNDSINTFFNHAMFLDKYQGANSNTILSGRFELWIDAWNIFTNNSFIGIGNYYVDLFYLELLTEGGIIEFLIIIPIVLLRFTNSFFKKIINVQNINYLVKILTVYVIISSIFEARIPFGPGTSMCMFWIICGYFDYISSKEMSNK